MEKAKVKEIEIKLQQIIKRSKQAQHGVNLDFAQTGTGLVIRRRKGESDKRISVTTKPKPTLHCQHYTEK
jgi:hypothetical protein